MYKDNAHLYIPHLEALKDGELQRRAIGQWIDCDEDEFIGFEMAPSEYRRKPVTQLWLRNAECDAGIEGTFVATASSTGTTEEIIQTSPTFIRWIGERVYYEVTK